MTRSNTRRCRRACAAVAAAAFLAACSGIPLRSMPRLMKLQQDILHADPAQIVLAIQVDARMIPPAQSRPVFELAVRPRKAGAFEAVQRNLPMAFSVASAATLGLPAPPGGRRWLIYGFPVESQHALSQLQQSFQGREDFIAAQGGVSVSIGIAQEDLAIRDPALAGTAWATWLQTSSQEGFFEIWSGTVADLLEDATTSP